MNNNDRTLAGDAAHGRPLESSRVADADRRDALVHALLELFARQRRAQASISMPW